MTWDRLHDAGEDTSLAAVLLQGGIFERVEQWTPVDEVIKREQCELEQEEVAAVLVPLEDYEELMAAYGEHAQGLDKARHRGVRAGVCVVEPHAIEREMMRAKVNTLAAYNRYVWFDASNLWDAMRNLLAITLRHTPQFIKGMSGAQIGRLIGVGRAAFNRHKLKLVEEFLARWGVTPTAGPNGKGEEHRAKKSEQMQGRKHRAPGYQSDAEPLPERKYTDKQIARMAADQERRRVAELAGVSPEEITLEKTNPRIRHVSEAKQQDKRKSA